LRRVAERPVSLRRITDRADRHRWRAASVDHRLHPMDFYTFSLLLGGVGLGGMALSGVGQRGHVRGHSRGGTRGHGSRSGHSTTTGTARGARGGHRAAIKGAHRSRTDALHDSVWALMSPRVLFSVLLGVGATGLLFDSMLGGAALLGVAIAGGLLFERFLVMPIWRFALRFASNPATTLESCITDEATAVTSFDANGQGIVAVELDGQIVQILGTLQDADRAAGIRVRAGGRVRIEDVDPARNRCSVSVL
jgi:hypothetical protein